MKYYENNIYPIALVLSKDVESVNKDPLTDSSEEAWAYLQGWIAECLDDFLNN